MTVISRKTHPDARITFNGQDITHIWCQANAKGGWVTVYIMLKGGPKSMSVVLKPVPGGEPEKASGQPHTAQIFGDVEIDMSDRQILPVVKPRKCPNPKPDKSGYSHVINTGQVHVSGYTRDGWVCSCGYSFYWNGERYLVTDENGIGRECSQAGGVLTLVNQQRDEMTEENTTPKPMGSGKIEYTQQAFRRLLHLPTDAFIYGVKFNADDQSILVYVNHPDLPEVKETLQVPFVCPNLVKTAVYPVGIQVEFKGWL